MKKVTQRQTKAHNDRLILKTIYEAGQTSRADVARSTGLARTTVSDAVATWIDEGLVAEVGVGPSAGGKPPILLSVVDSSRYLIGIDLASNEFHGGIVDLYGKIVHRRTIEIGDRDGEAALPLVYTLLDDLLSSAPGPVLGIGIGAPGLMDAHGGIVRHAVNLGWTDLALKDILQERYELPVHIANDVQAAALAECTFGSGKEVSSLVVIRVGRGLGAGIVLNRKPYYGDGSGAGEIGHMKVVDDGERCRCGHYGCLETVVNRRAIVRRARSIALDPRSILHRFAAQPKEIDLEAVVEAFQAGDELVREIVLDTATYLGRAISGLVCALNVQRIVLSGSVTHFGPEFLKAIRREVMQGTLAWLVDGTQIEFTTLDPDIVVLGAAALLLTYELEIV
jgi:glucokinase-like ROK family protein